MSTNLQRKPAWWRTTLTIVVEVSTLLSWIVVIRLVPRRKFTITLLEVSHLSRDTRANLEIDISPELLCGVEIAGGLMESMGEVGFLADLMTEVSHFPLARPHAACSRERCLFKKDRISIGHASTMSPKQ